MAHNKTENLPTSAKAWVVFCVSEGIGYEGDTEIAFTEAAGIKLYRRAVRQVVKDELGDKGWGDLPPYSPSFTDEVCEHWYHELADGERDADIYLAEIDIPLVDLPYYQLATSLAVALDSALRALTALDEGAGYPMTHGSYRPLLENANRVMERARKELVAMQAPESYT
jgi:hypothetical protein